MILSNCVSCPAVLPCKGKYSKYDLLTIHCNTVKAFTFPHLPAKNNLAWGNIFTLRPYFLLGAPPCFCFSVFVEENYLLKS